MKILFLDVDGVINVPHGMDRRLLENLKSIVDETQCKIVLSSDWRNTPAARSEIRGILRSVGMDYISCTPPSKSPLQARRPEEITDWIRVHNAKVERHENAHGKSDQGLQSVLGKVENFVAIDDRPLLTEVGGAYLRGHFVHTSTRIGLTAPKAQQAKDILLGRTGEQPSAGPPPGEATAFRAQRHVGSLASDLQLPPVAKRHLGHVGDCRSSSLTAAALQQLAKTQADKRAMSMPARHRGKIW